MSYSRKKRELLLFTPTWIMFWSVRFERDWIILHQNFKIALCWTRKEQLELFRCFLAWACFEATSTTQLKYFQFDAIAVQLLVIAPCRAISSTTSFDTKRKSSLRCHRWIVSQWKCTMLWLQYDIDNITLHHLNSGNVFQNKKHDNNKLICVV